MAPSDAGGLIFGYATLSEAAIAKGVRLLADAIRPRSSRRSPAASR
jgi:hypothetical protein